MGKTILHISEANISENSGMGRVEYHWAQEFLKRGYNFIHIGPNEIGNIPHPAFFPYLARRYYFKVRKSINIDLLIVHEPISGIFVNGNIPVILESHGIERREWDLRLRSKDGYIDKVKLRSKLLFPLWRLRIADKGLKRANLLLLINKEDVHFVKSYYNRSDNEIFHFKNGVYRSGIQKNTNSSTIFFTILFIGTWIERKGIRLLVEAGKLLFKNSFNIRWIIAGSGVDEAQVLNDWPPELRSSIQVIPNYNKNDELELFKKCDLFVLPSYFEGQPLSLLQAMETGTCCITTKCCGQKDIIKHEQNGLLIKKGESSKLVNLINKCIKDERFRNKIGENAKISMQNRCWDTVSFDVVDRIEMFLDDI